MTAPPAAAPSRPRERGGSLQQQGLRWKRMAFQGGLCATGWLASVLVGYSVDSGPELHRIALGVHILALVLSFGAVLVVDWLGLLWLVGRRELRESARLEGAAKPLIWGGLALLLASGAFIHPDLGNPVTAAKLGCVLLLMLNGISIGPAMDQLSVLPARTRFAEIGRTLQLRLLVALGISQACWWTSVLIGLLNSTARRWTGA